ncbi:tripartite tricarboxylate transporter TctB family protein [Paracoccus aerodenitrificans]|uniref:tripartite tricarboxylate transporter TctB family protein n=1 Tax=Paracoccus aerodenitrificans TaxID=3017781 RepID=UPI0022EFEEF7|nr:tripartite tricarboxylate transporter TctB family protein [Paracoccus aerodenitrificans]WBU64136.1 tripartite tricarboxylate transporter TctB family protein [Paracoccus aerodenitrificans]
MADRVLGLALLALAIFYGAIAFTIKAPFQYDPLGPESWPKLLSFVLGICAIIVIMKPDPDPDWGDASSLRKLAVCLAGLIVYAMAFEPLGYLLSTLIFGGLMAWYCGASLRGSAIFAAIAGIGGWVLFEHVLDLQVPAGLISF